MSFSTSKTPPHKIANRMPRLSPSFASCFGATAPVSPRGQLSRLAGEASVNYMRVHLQDFEDEELQHEGGATEYRDHQFGTAAFITLGKHNSSFKERPSTRKSEAVYASEGEQGSARRRGHGSILKMGSSKQGEKTWSGRISKKKIMYESEGEKYHEYGKHTEIQVHNDSDKRRGDIRVKTKREKEMEDVEAAESPRARASFGRRVREACVQVLETARRGSPHLNELFVGNQLLMQVTATSSRHSKSLAPSYGFHVYTNEYPSYSPPARFTPSTF